MDISVVVRDRVLLAHESRRLGEMIPVPAMPPVILLFTLLCCGDFALAMWRLKKETVN